MNSKLRDILILVAAASLLVVCIPAMGQVLKGSISGTVVDPQGALVSGAHVKATHIATGGVSTTTSDNAGSFHFNLIATGDYKIEVSAQGFKTAVQGSILVAAGRDTGLGNLQLTVGETSTTVEVTATTPLIEATQSQITNTFTGTALSSFAGVQENQGLDNLALFVPGVASVRDNGFSNSNGGVGFSSNGLRGRNNDQEIDGQNNNDNSVGGPSLFVSDPEFVGQYVLITNNFGPEYGRNAGSVVNIITKSGSNGWHGSVYANENNSYLNTLTSTQSANGLTKPPRANDEFGGGTIGGPLVKNKAFFFGGFDNEILSSGTLYASGLVTPTPAGLATLASCFPSGPSADAVAALTKFGPAGISAGNPVFTAAGTAPVAGCGDIPVGTVSRLLPTPVHAFNWITKEDLQLGKDTISGRYIFNRSNAFNTNDNGAAGYVVNVPALSQAVLISWTHNFGSRMVNEARVGFGRLNLQFGGNSIGTEPTVGNLSQALTNVNFLDGATLGYGPNPVLPQGRFVNTWQAQDNWNFVLGRHQLKAGVNFTHQQSPNTFLPNINGQYNYNSLSDYVNQLPAFVNIDVGNPELGLVENDTFMYFGDDWKVTRNLTLNLGVTWTYYGQPYNLVNKLDMQNETGPNPLWDPTLPLSVRVSPTINTYNTAIGPSIGFAYSPSWGGFMTGHGKTVFRGGYRLLYDPPFYNIYLNNYTGSPNILGASLTSGNLNLPAAPFGPAVRANLGPSIPLGVLDPRTLGEVTVPQNFRADKVQSWSLGFERQITKNSALEARYAGNHAVNLFQALDSNPYVGSSDPAFLPGLAQFFPNLVPPGVTGCSTPSGSLIGISNGHANCNQGLVLTRDNTGYSDYNALQVEFRANNMFKQLTMRTGYTFSKTTDNVSEIFPTVGGGSTIEYAQNPFNTATGEHSLSGLDFPQEWTVTFVETLPFFKEQHGFLGHALGGWSFSGTYILASGQTYNPFMVAFANLTDGSNLTQFGTINSGAFGGASVDFYDQAFLNQFLGAGVARPFIGNTSAPGNTVGIFEGDACYLAAVIGALPAVACTGGPNNQLISLNALNATNPSAQVVTKDQVHFIANTAFAQQIFGTPFGNAPRNSLRDAPSNTGNLSIIKNLKLGEHESFEFRASFINVFNHANFATVNPFVENAGNPNFGNSFANPSLTGDSIPGSNLAASRRIYFGGTFRF
jgi:Carboxypeptidase regulatory-like domain